MVAEKQLRKQLDPSLAQGQVRNPTWDVVNSSFVILIRSCLLKMSSSTSESTPEDVETATVCVLGWMSTLKEGLLLEAVKNIFFPMSGRAMLCALDTLLAFLCESESARSRAPGDLLDSISNVLSFSENYDGEHGPWKGLKDETNTVRRTLERLKALREGEGQCTKVACGSGLFAEMPVCTHPIFLSLPTN